MEKQGGIYARYSPSRDRDQGSVIKAQVARCREKAQREGFQAMLAAIKTSDFPEILYAKDSKRLFRNEREAGSRCPNPRPFPTLPKTRQH